MGWFSFFAHYAHYSPVSIALFLCVNVCGEKWGMDTRVITGVSACLIMHVCLTYISGLLMTCKMLLFTLSLTGLCDVRSLNSSWATLQRPRLYDNTYLNGNCSSRHCPSPLKPLCYIMWILPSCLSFTPAFSTGSTLCVCASLRKTDLNEGYNYAGV